MRLDNHVLKMKLAPPSIKKHMLRRPQLTRKLKRLTDYPLTLVHSGPGYGKSTALSGYIRTAGSPYAWYGISAQDDDLFPFVMHMVYAIRQREDWFGELVLSALQQEHHVMRESEIYRLADLFLNDLAHVSGEFVLVLDDYHNVEHSQEIELWMQYILRYLPDMESLRLVIMSRTRPAWDGLLALKVRGEMMELTKNDLAFSEEEVEVLFADNYEYPLTKAQIAQIYEKTEGWVIAIQLFWQRLLIAEGDISQVLSEPLQTMDDLFRFLALELFLKQPKTLQLFMLQTSILDLMNEEMCDAVCGYAGSQDLLKQLYARNLFLTQVDDRQYRYHALFRDFLVGELRKHTDLYIQLHRKAAEYFRAQGESELALLHLEAMDDSEQIALLIHLHGPEMIRRGHLEQLLTRLQRMPASIKRQYPSFYVYEGDIYRYRCVYDKAFHSYMEGEHLASNQDDVILQSLALQGQAQVFLDTIQPGKAEILLLRAIELMESLSEEDAMQAVRLYGLMAENLVNSGRAGEAEQWYERCLAMDPQYDDVLLESRLRLRTGRLAEAKQVLERAKRTDEQGAALALSRSHREVELLLSLIESFSGEPLAAKASAESGMMHGIRLNAPYVEACGWMRMGHAAELLGQYDHQIALDCYKTSLRIMERLDLPRGKAEPLMGLCLLYGRARSVDLAMQYGRQALAETEKVSDGWLSSLIRIGMGIAAFYAEQWQEAQHIFQDCLTRFERCGDRFGMTVSWMWLASTAFRMEDDTSFAAWFEQSLRLAEEGGYSFLFLQRTLFGPTDPQQLVPLLLEAKRLHLCKMFVSSLLIALSMDQLSQHPGYTLRIETLGACRVWLGDQELGEKDWLRGKAKELFQLLVTKRQRPLGKEEIFGMLLPALDEKSANRDFKVALNALQTALEPHRRARSHPYFIIRIGTSYQLNPNAFWILDTVEFEKRVKEGLEADEPNQAILALEQGLQLYKGDYMPERRYDDWCIEERERLQVLYLRGAERLAQLYAESGQYNKSIRFCEAMLQKDVCWEEAYRLLIQCHVRLNNRNQAMKWYHKCVSALEQELGIEPMPQTKELYLKLTDMQGHVTHL